MWYNLFMKKKETKPVVKEEVKETKINPEIPEKKQRDLR